MYIICICNLIDGPRVRTFLVGPCRDSVRQEILLDKRFYWIRLIAQRTLRQAIRRDIACRQLVSAMTPTPLKRESYVLTTN